MINAERAVELSVSTDNEKFTKLSKTIEAAILRAANDGHRSVVQCISANACAKPHADRMVGVLSDLGYTAKVVANFDARDGNYYTFTINW